MIGSACAPRSGCSIPFFEGTLARGVWGVGGHAWHARTHAHSRTDYWCDCCHGHGVLPRALDWSSPSFVTLSSDSQSCHELAIERQPARLYAKLLRLFISSWQLQEWFVIASGASGNGHLTAQLNPAPRGLAQSGPDLMCRLAPPSMALRRRPTLQDTCARKRRRLRKLLFNAKQLVVLGHTLGPARRPRFDLAHT